MSNFSIKAIIEILLKGSGAKDASKALRDVETQTRKTKAAAEQTAGVFSRLKSSIVSFFEGLRGRGRDSVSESFDKTTKAAGGLRLAIGKLAASFAALFAVQRVGGFVAQSVKEFAALDRALRATAIAMQNLGLDATSALPRVRQVVETIQAGGGPLVTETIPAFQKFIGITRDTEAAIAAVELSADIAESGLMDMGAAAEQIANILQGRSAMAAKALGLQLRETNGEQRSALDLLVEAQRQYGGLADSVEDSQNKLDKLSGAWTRAKQAVGEIVAQYLPQILALTDAVTKAIVFTATGFSALVSGLAETAQQAAKIVVAAFDFKTLFSEGPTAYRDALNRQVLESVQSVTLVLEEEAKKQQAILAKTAATGAKATADGYAKLGDIAARAVAQENEAAAREATESATKLAEKRLAIERKTQEDLLKARLAATEQGSRARLDVELEILRYGEELALSEVEASEEAKSRVRETFMLARETVEAEYRAKTEAAEADHLERQTEQLAAYYQRAIDLERQASEEQAAAKLERADLDAESGVPGASASAFTLALEQEIAAVQAHRDALLSEAEITEAARERVIETAEMRIATIRARYAKFQVDTERQSALQRRAIAASFAQDATAALGQIFGESKAILIAQAIADTFAGANRALGAYPPPLNFVMAGLVTAAGLANVARIRSAAPGSGSGAGAASRPLLSTGAVYGGAAQPQLTTGKIVSTPSAPSAPQSPGSQAVGRGEVSNTWNSRSGDVNISAGVVVADDATITELARRLERAARRDRARVAK